MNCRPKASGLQFCGSIVYCSWLFLDVICYEADILIYKQTKITHYLLVSVKHNFITLLPE
jgi:hypothetical protein